MLEATIFCAPNNPDGERYGLYIGAWNDPDKIILEGFETSWDAWAFAICNGMNDPMPPTKSNRRRTCSPPPKKIYQLEMELGEQCNSYKDNTNK